MYDIVNKSIKFVNSKVGSNLANQIIISNSASAADVSKLDNIELKVYDITVESDLNVNNNENIQPTVRAEIIDVVSGLEDNSNEKPCQSDPMPMWTIFNRKLMNFRREVKRCQIEHRA